MPSENTDTQNLNDTNPSPIAGDVFHPTSVSPAPNAASAGINNSGGATPPVLPSTEPATTKISAGSSSSVVSGSSDLGASAHQSQSMAGGQLTNPFENSVLSTPSIESASSMQQTQTSKPARRFKPSKVFIISLLVFFVLAGGSAGAYFGYFVPNKPPNVWRSALINSGKGYDKLAGYATSNKNAKGLKANGSFKLSGPAAVDGSFSGQSDGSNGELTGNVSAVGVKVNYDIRAIASAKSTPDIYFKVDGLQGLGSLIGSYIGDPATSKQVSDALNGLNGQWYFVDHTLFDQFAQGSNSSLQFSTADISAVLSAVGNANKQYLFTKDDSKMAIVVKQYFGKEKQDGRGVYHYKIGVNKANLSAYGKALCGNLVKTKLFKTFEGNSTPDTDLIQTCQNDLGLDSVDASRTADAWVDLHTKLIHKIRFTDKANAQNYTDIGQDYQGGNIFPFSISTHSSSDGDVQSGALNIKLNTTANTLNLAGNFSDSADKSNVTLSLNIAPSNGTVKVDKPANSKTFIQLLNDLGISDLFSDSTSNGTSPSPAPGSSQQAIARDAERKSDIATLQSKVEEYWTNNNGQYPMSLAQVSGMPASACQAPGGKGTCANPDYLYKPFSSNATPSTTAKSDCDNNTDNDCQNYIIYTPSSGAGAMETITNPYSVSSLTFSQ